MLSPIVYIEYCTDCQSHMWCTHHDEQRYLHAYLRIRSALEKYAIKVVGNQVPSNYSCVNQQEHRYVDLSNNRFVQFPAIGAFEVKVLDTLVFSKKQCNMWPNTKKLVAEVLVILGIEDSDTQNSKHQQLPQLIKFDTNSLSKAPKKAAKIIRKSPDSKSFGKQQATSEVNVLAANFQGLPKNNIYKFNRQNPSKDLKPFQPNRTHFAKHDSSIHQNLPVFVRTPSGPSLLPKHNIKGSSSLPRFNVPQMGIGYNYVSARPQQMIVDAEETISERNPKQNFTLTDHFKRYTLKKQTPDFLDVETLRGSDKGSIQMSENSLSDSQTSLIGKQLSEPNKKKEFLIQLDAIEEESFEENNPVLRRIKLKSLAKTVSGPLPKRLKTKTESRTQTVFNEFHHQLSNLQSIFDTFEQKVSDIRRRNKELEFSRLQMGDEIVEKQSQTLGVKHKNKKDNGNHQPVVVSSNPKVNSIESYVLFNEENKIKKLRQIYGYNGDLPESVLPAASVSNRMPIERPPTNNLAANKQTRTGLSPKPRNLVMENFQREQKRTVTPTEGYTTRPSNQALNRAKNDSYKTSQAFYSQKQKASAVGKAQSKGWNEHLNKGHHSNDTVRQRFDEIQCQSSFSNRGDQLQAKAPLRKKHTREWQLSKQPRASNDFDEEGRASGIDYQDEEERDFQSTPYQYQNSNSWRNQTKHPLRHEISHFGEHNLTAIAGSYSTKKQQANADMYRHRVNPASYGGENESTSDVEQCDIDKLSDVSSARIRGAGLSNNKSGEFGRQLVASNQGSHQGSNNIRNQNKNQQSNTAHRDSQNWSQVEDPNMNILFRREHQGQTPSLGASNIQNGIWSARNNNGQIMPPAVYEDSDHGFGITQIDANKKTVVDRGHISQGQVVNDSNQIQHLGSNQPGRSIDTPVYSNISPSVSKVVPTNKNRQNSQNNDNLQSDNQAAINQMKIVNSPQKSIINSVEQPKQGTMHSKTSQLSKEKNNKQASLTVSQNGRQKRAPSSSSESSQSSESSYIRPVLSNIHQKGKDNKKQPNEQQRNLIVKGDSDQCQGWKSNNHQRKDQDRQSNGSTHHRVSQINQEYLGQQQTQQSNQLAASQINSLPSQKRESPKMNQKGQKVQYQHSQRHNQLNNSNANTNQINDNTLQQSQQITRISNKRLDINRASVSKEEGGETKHIDNDIEGDRKLNEENKGKLPERRSEGNPTHQTSQLNSKKHSQVKDCHSKSNTQDINQKSIEDGSYGLKDDNRETLQQKIPNGRPLQTTANSQLINQKINIVVNGKVKQQVQDNKQILQKSNEIVKKNNESKIMVPNQENSMDSSQTEQKVKENVQQKPTLNNQQAHLTSQKRRRQLYQNDQNSQNKQVKDQPKGKIQATFQNTVQQLAQQKDQLVKQIIRKNEQSNKNEQQNINMNNGVQKQLLSTQRVQNDINNSLNKQISNDSLIINSVKKQQNSQSKVQINSSNILDQPTQNQSKHNYNVQSEPNKSDQTELAQLKTAALKQAVGNQNQNRQSIKQEGQKTINQSQKMQGNQRDNNNDVCQGNSQKSMEKKQKIVNNIKQNQLLISQVQNVNQSNQSNQRVQHQTNSALKDSSQQGKLHSIVNNKSELQSENTTNRATHSQTNKQTINQIIKSNQNALNSISEQSKIVIEANQHTVFNKNEQISNQRNNINPSFQVRQHKLINQTVKPNCQPKQMNQISQLAENPQPIESQTKQAIQHINNQINSHSQNNNKELPINLQTKKSSSNNVNQKQFQIDKQRVNNNKSEPKLLQENLPKQQITDRRRIQQNSKNPNKSQQLNPLKTNNNSVFTKGQDTNNYQQKQYQQAAEIGGLATKQPRYSFQTTNQPLLASKPSISSVSPSDSNRPLGSLPHPFQAGIVSHLYNNQRETAQEKIRFNQVLEDGDDRNCRMPSVLKPQDISSLHLENNRPPLEEVLMLLARRSQWLLWRLVGQCSDHRGQLWYGVWLCLRGRWKLIPIKHYEPATTDVSLNKRDSNYSIQTTPNMAHLQQNNLMATFLFPLLLNAIDRLKSKRPTTAQILHFLTGCNSQQFRVKEDPTKNDKLIKSLSRKRNFLNVAQGCFSRTPNSNSMNPLNIQNNSISVINTPNFELLSSSPRPVLHAFEIVSLLQQQPNSHPVLEVRSTRSGHKNVFIKLETFCSEFSAVTILHLKTKQNMNFIEVGGEDERKDSNQINGRSSTPMSDMSLYRLNQPTQVALWNVTHVVLLQNTQDMQLLGTVTLHVLTQQDEQPTIRPRTLRVLTYRETKPNIFRFVGEAKQRGRASVFFECGIGVGSRYFLFISGEQDQSMVSSEAVLQSGRGEAVKFRIAYAGQGQPILRYVECLDTSDVANEKTQYLTYSAGGYTQLSSNGNGPNSTVNSNSYSNSPFMGIPPNNTSYTNNMGHPYSHGSNNNTNSSHFHNYPLNIPPNIQLNIPPSIPTRSQLSDAYPTSRTHTNNGYFQANNNMHANSHFYHTNNNSSSGTNTVSGTNWMRGQQRSSNNNNNPNTNNNNNSNNNPNPNNTNNNNNKPYSPYHNLNHPNNSPPPNELQSHYLSHLPQQTQHNSQEYNRQTVQQFKSSFIDYYVKKEKQRKGM